MNIIIKKEEIAKLLKLKQEKPVLNLDRLLNNIVKKSERYNEFINKTDKEHFYQFLKKELPGYKIENILNKHDYCVEFLEDVLLATGYQISFKNFIKAMESRSSLKKQLFFKYLPENCELTNCNNILNMNNFCPRTKDLAEIKLIKDWFKGEVDKETNEYLNESFKIKINFEEGSPWQYDFSGDIFNSIKFLNYNLKKISSINKQNTILHHLISICIKEFSDDYDNWQFEHLDVDALALFIHNKKAWEIKDGKGQTVSEKFSQLLLLLEKTTDNLTKSNKVNGYYLKELIQKIEKSRRIYESSQINLSLEKSKNKTFNKI